MVQHRPAEEKSARISANKPINLVEPEKGKKARTGGAEISKELREKRL